LRLDDAGEPVYGPRDAVDLTRMAGIGLPFWVAGGRASAAALRAARSAGATGVQVGSAFALCRESGVDPDLRRQMLDRALAGGLVVRNEPYASPTGFPFKAVQLADTLTSDEVYAARTRLCDLGYLRSPYRRTDGAVGYRCPAEPVAIYVRKGGSEEETVDRRCLCNGLTATVGLASVATTARPNRHC
jgi:NAD(P)H-dependent flavin oxidoreductase YrpB (nitropropane dioxygenase family)